MKPKVIAAAAVFLAGAAYFCVRGPYRAMISLDSYDFATVYGATRAWVDGENPYDMGNVLRELVNAGHDPTEKNSEPPPSIYLPSTPPLMTAIGWLRWPVAKIVWCLLSMSVFVASLSFVLKNVSIPIGAKWLLAGCMLFFSPTTSGLSTGNPSVMTCALCLLALHVVNRWGTAGSRCGPLPGSSPAFSTARFWIAGILLGIANCLKPQDSILVIVIFLLCHCWRTLLISFAMPVIAGLISIWRAGSLATFVAWIHSCQEAVAGTFTTGGLSDPRPSNAFSYHIVTLPSIFGLFISNLRTEDVLSWLVAGLIAAVYLTTRTRVEKAERLWRDLAFFSALTLTIVYHRYYDAQLLLAAIPFLIRYRNVHRATVMLYSICLASLWFPLQPMFAQIFHNPDPRSVTGFLMLRHEPVLIVAMALILIPWRAAAFSRCRGDQSRFEDSTLNQPCSL